MMRLNEINRDLLFNNINNRDQFVPDVKMEDEEETYYQMYGTGSKYTTMNEMNLSSNNLSNSNSNNYNLDSNNSNNNINNNNNNNSNDFKVPPMTSICGTSSNSPHYDRNDILRHNYMNSNTDTNMSMRNNYIVSSDGEGSPKSIDENDSSPVYCVRGVRTITRNPGRITRQRGVTGITKCNRGRGRKTEFTAPKEKDRARLFNEAFDGLRKRIPSIPASKKLSKIEILRLAICYMSYLKFLLETDCRRNYDSPTICTSTPSPSSIEDTSTSQVGSIIEINPAEEEEEESITPSS